MNEAEAEELMVTELKLGKQSHPIVGISHLMLVWVRRILLKLPHFKEVTNVGNRGTYFGGGDYRRVGEC